MAFDPDKYLEEDEKTEMASSEFDPDAFLGEKAPEVPEVEEPSQLEAGIRGAAQGLTFDFADELLGALKAGGETLFGEAKIKDLLDTYRQQRDIEREKFKAAEEAHPVTYLAGEIAGGIAPAFATGGATAVAGGVKSIGKQALKQALKTGGRKAAEKEILKQAAKQAAKAGAKYGAISGLGRTEADVTEGEVGEAVKDIAAGAIGGAAMGAAIPAATKAIKPVTGAAKKAKDWLADKSGKAVREVMEASKIAREGGEVVGQKVMAGQKEAVENLAESVEKAVREVAKPQAKKLVGEALGYDARIKVGKSLDKHVKSLNDELAKFAPDSDEAKSLNSAIKLIQNQKQQLIEGGLTDPSILTKSEAYQKLLKKVEDIRFMNDMGVPQAKAIDNLFNRAAKIKKGFEPDKIVSERIAKDFNLDNTDTAIEMLKDVAKLKIKKPKINPKTGEVTEIPVELTEVIKKYEPRIGEKQGRLFIERGPGQIRESEIMRFRPDELSATAEMTPQQLFDLQREVSERIAGAPGAARKTLTGISKEMREQLEGSVPEELKEQFKEGMAKYSDIYRLEDLIGKGITSPLGGAEQTKAREKLVGIIEKMHDLGGAAADTSRVSRQDILQTLKRLTPEIGETFEKEAGKAAKNLELSRISDKVGFQSLGGTAEAVGVRTGAAIGTIQRKFNQLAHAGGDEIANVASQVRTASPKFANFLDNLAKVDSPSRRQALLFSASQKPDLREDIKAFLGEEEE